MFYQSTMVGENSAEVSDEMYIPLDRKLYITGKPQEIVLEYTSRY